MSTATIVTGILSFMVIVVVYVCANCTTLFLPTKKNKSDRNFKVDFGQGLVNRTWEQMENLTPEEKEYLFKNAKACTTFRPNLEEWEVKGIKSMTEMFKGCTVNTEPLSLGLWDTSNMGEIRSLKKIVLN